jgi:hypothetical protein
LSVHQIFAVKLRKEAVHPQNRAISASARPLALLAFGRPPLLTTAVCPPRSSRRRFSSRDLGIGAVASACRCFCEPPDLDGRDHAAANLLIPILHPPEQDIGAAVSRRHAIAIIAAMLRNRDLNHPRSVRRCRQYCCPPGASGCRDQSRLPVAQASVAKKQPPSGPESCPDSSLEW